MSGGAIISQPAAGAERGLTIVEVVVAAALLLVVCAAAFMAVSSGLRLQATARQRATATDFADRLMEVARNQRYEDLGLATTTAEMQAAVAGVAVGDTDNPDLLVRRDAASGCLEFNTGTSASPAWERLVVADRYTSPEAASSCATQTVDPDLDLAHTATYTPAGTPAVTYSGWVFVTWALVDGYSVYYKRVTVMVRFPSPTGGVSRVVRMSSLFSLGYVPVPSTTSTSTSTTSTSTSTTSTTTTTVPADVTPPPAPVLTGTARGQRIDLDWTVVSDPSGIRHYLVFRRAGGTTTQLATETVTSYRDSAVQGGQSYAYWVVAVDGAGNQSSPSNQITETAR